MGIEALVEQLRASANCEVHKPAGVPSVGLSLPSDLGKFYELCGGATLHQGADYSIAIVSPADFVRANPIIVGQDCKDDISFDWFVVATTGDQNITIDLNETRVGHCYDSFWDCHGVAGSCQIVAMTFESLLAQLIDGKGAYWFWLQDTFEDLGDAYDPT